MTFKEIVDITGNTTDTELIANIAMRHITPQELCNSIDMECANLEMSILKFEAENDWHSVRTTKTRLRLLRKISKNAKDMYNIYTGGQTP